MKKSTHIYSQNSKIILEEDDLFPKSSLKDVVRFVTYFQREKISATHNIKSSSLNLLQQQFFGQYKIVEAAGGVVLNEKDELLLIHRRGFWDLPKGKLELGEKKRDCAIREVQEECGLGKVNIIEKLKLDYNGKHVTFHTYISKQIHHLKLSYWYVMEAKKQKLIPQIEEDITEAKWVKLKDVPDYYSSSYPAIRDVLRSVILQLDQ